MIPNEAARLQYSVQTLTSVDGVMQVFKGLSVAFLQEIKNEKCNCAHFLRHPETERTFTVNRSKSVAVNAAC